MPEKTPQAIKRVQPEEFKELLCGRRSVFTLWPEDAACRFLASYRDKLANKDAYPVGMFPGGDVILFDEGRVSVFLHETLECVRTSFDFAEFMRRILAADFSLEDGIFDFVVGD